MSITELATIMFVVIVLAPLAGFVGCLIGEQYYIWRHRRR